MICQEANILVDDVYVVHFCPNCDTVVGYDDDKFYHYCPNCGEKIVGNTEALERKYIYGNL